MNPARVPWLACVLLRRCSDPRYRESLEGDLLEELAKGRTALWYWRQVACAVHAHGIRIARQHLRAVFAATLFFLLSLWAIAPATYPVLDWAQTLNSSRILLILGWLAGVPLLLGAIAGAAQRQPRVAILLGAALAYFTPVALPFDSAVCNLCASPGNVVPDLFVYLGPLAAGLLAALGARLTQCNHTPAS